MGWGEPVHGTDTEGKEVTASFGYDKHEGHTMLADGHKATEQFRQSDQHDHYGPGKGPNDNGTSRGQYTGQGS